jgi:hypothetical protein
MCGRFGLESKIAFVAQLPREATPARLDEHDICLFRSIWPECMAHCTMDAMVEGLLVIGSEVDGQTGLLRHGRCALTFAAEDAATVAGHIAAMADDPAGPCRLARPGHELVSSRFKLDRMVDDIEQLRVAITTADQASMRRRQGAPRQDCMEPERLALAKPRAAAPAWIARPQRSRFWPTLDTRAGTLRRPGPVAWRLRRPGDAISPKGRRRS